MTEKADPATFDINRLYDPSTDAVAAELVATEQVAPENTEPLLVSDSPEVQTSPEQVPAIILHRGAILEGVREETARAA